MLKPLRLLRALLFCAAPLCGATLLCGALLQASAAATQLQPFEARYQMVLRGMTVAESTMKLSTTGGDQWTYSAISEPRGLARLIAPHAITQVSDMRMSAIGIQPLHYVGDDGKASKDRDIDLHFDWEKLRVTGTAAAASVDEPISAGTQDDLSVQVALMFELANGRTPATIKTYGDRGAREYKYSREGKETLQTPLGAIETIVYRSERSGSPRVTRYWCAPSLGFLPLRAQQKRLDDVEWTMDIRSLQR
jgi:Protein of unknown function (DUF3108)